MEKSIQPKEDTDVDYNSAFEELISSDPNRKTISLEDEKKFKQLKGRYDEMKTKIQLKL